MLKGINKGKLLIKPIEWIKRYLPAEIAAIIGALFGGLLTHYLFQNPIMTALGGTWGENAGYYGKILFDDFKKRKLKYGKVTLGGVLKILRNAIIEFGPGEYLDSFIIRPAAMYFFLKVTGSVPLGLFLGKISADITFYIPTIMGYEFRKKYIKD